MLVRERKIIKNSFNLFMGIIRNLCVYKDKNISIQEIQELFILF